MISTRMLIKLAQKWRKTAALGRKRISFSILIRRSNPEGVKGHFVVYSVDGIRFCLPLTYLNNYVFIELLKIAEEEYGITGDEPITLPFEGHIINYLILLLERKTPEEIQKALIMSLTPSCCSSSSQFSQFKNFPQPLLSAY